MEKHELNEFIINLVGVTNGMQIITAVNKYCSASNDANRLLWAGWISADKKPIPEKDVLICTTDNYIVLGWYYDDSNEWAFECDKETSDHSGIVAYWCDLPACP